MRELEIETKTKGFTGTLKIKVPSVAERFAIIKKMGLKVTEKGMDVEELKSDLGMIAKIIEEVDSLIVDCDLKYGETKVTKEDLGYYTEATPVYFEVLTFAIQGMTLGKS